MQALRLLRIQAHASHLANLRLHGALAGLSADERNVPRTSFLPSRLGTRGQRHGGGTAPAGRASDAQ
jgi:hypothetical protein